MSEIEPLITPEVPGPAKNHRSITSILVIVIITLVIGIIALLLQIIPQTCPTLECEDTTVLVANCPPVPPAPVPLGSSDIGPCWQPNIPPSHVDESMANNRLLQDAKTSIDTYLASQDFKSISYVVTWGEQMMFGGFGLVNTSDTSSGVPSPDDVFRIGSITKTFTSALLFMLWQEGKLGLDELISVKWPEMPIINPYDDDESYNPITYRMLTSHLSGLIAGFPCLPDNCDYTTQEIFDRLKYPTLQYAPSVDPVYNNYAFALLGRLFEHEDVTNEQFETAVREYIWDILDLRMGWSEDDQDAGYVGTVITNNSPGDYPDLGWINPAGGAFSSARELGKWLVWLQDFHTSTLLKPSTKRSYLLPQYAFENARELMGAAWDQLWRHGTWVLDKSGEMAPFYSNTQFIPDMKLGIAILTNSPGRGAPSVSELCGQAMEFLIPAVDALNGMYGDAKLQAIPESHKGRYIGDYGLGGFTALSVVDPGLGDGTLMLLGREDPSEELEPWAQLSQYPTYNGDDLKHTLRMTVPQADLGSCYTFRLSGSDNDVCIFDGLTDDEGGDAATQVIVPSFVAMWFERIN
eukprot:gnl/Dysnectes_brevis/2629_a3176_1283.p1 GENE.gnl/Dysnectes_brevis/2629_a3176_1283~~gnl/Dysnectes_brevis/2629_a3176_1283.p1  ORF type:complete len:578 (+),score=98.33 gnl/Dysnectes_brevis/2629_a3176_1283:115-1848(+)